MRRYPLFTVVDPDWGYVYDDYPTDGEFIMPYEKPRLPGKILKWACLVFPVIAITWKVGQLVISYAN